jgi:N-acylglucosamine 2-epimerase
LARIAHHALELGWDSSHGGLLRYVDRDGGAPTGGRSVDPYEQLVVDTWDTKLWWPHAEALYATALLADAGADPHLAEWHARLRDYTLRTFPEGPGREWTQIRNRVGEPLEKTVALPVKDPFHIARALLMLVELQTRTGENEGAQ